MDPIEKIKFNQTFYGGLFQIDSEQEIGFLTSSAAFKYIEDWCKENCNDWFYISPINDVTQYSISPYVEAIFESKEDYVAFKLKWL